MGRWDDGTMGHGTDVGTLGDADDGTKQIEGVRRDAGEDEKDRMPAQGYKEELAHKRTINKVSDTYGSRRNPNFVVFFDDPIDFLVKVGAKSGDVVGFAVGLETLVPVFAATILKDEDGSVAKATGAPSLVIDESMEKGFEHVKILLGPTVRPHFAEEDAVRCGEGLEGELMVGDAVTGRPVGRGWGERDGTAAVD